MKEKKATDDPVNPSHYKKGKIEVIDFILDQKLDFPRGSVVKYVCRAPYKEAELQDLEKARWYLNTAIRQLNPDDDQGDLSRLSAFSLVRLLESLRHDRLKYQVTEEEYREVDDSIFDIDITLLQIKVYIDKDKKRRENFDKGLKAHQFVNHDKKLFSGLFELNVVELPDPETPREVPKPVEKVPDQDDLPF